jgi:hypothetical protein
MLIFEIHKINIVADIADIIRMIFSLVPTLINSAVTTADSRQNDIYSIGRPIDIYEDLYFADKKLNIRVFSSESKKQYFNK